MKRRARSRAEAGAVATRRGFDFERWIVKYIFAPAIKGGLFQRVDRQHPSMAPAGFAAGKVPLYVMAQKSGADWIALVCASARCSCAYVALEAKSVDGDSLGLSGIADHQIEHLNDAALQRQGSILLVYFSASAAGYAIPWARAPWTTTARGSSIRKDSLPDAWRLGGWTVLKELLCQPT